MTKNLEKQQDTYIESREPANNRYGQNASPLPSSVTTNKLPARSAFAPAQSEAERILADGDRAEREQFRRISDRPVGATAHGHRSPYTNPAKVPPNGRPVTKPAEKNTWPGKC